MDSTGKGLKGYDYLIVGTGPGGAPVARELSRAGARVLMIERGARHERLLGAPFGPRILEGAGVFCRSVEGVYIGRGITVGGSSMVYNANVFNTPNKVFQQLGIDFSPEVAEVRQEIGVRQLPDRFFEHWTGGRRLLEAAESMGLFFRPQDKFIDPDRCRVGCDACMLGCSRGAKFTTRTFVDQAVEAGAELLTSTPVARVLFEDGKARGVLTRNGRTIHGDRVILSAGGIGTPRILAASGLAGAGENFYMDPMDIVVGYAREPGQGCWREMSFTHAIEDLKETERFIIGNVSATGALATSALRLKMFRHHLPRAPHAKRAMGLFVKLADEHQGRVFPDGRISKPFTETDRTRMARGVEISREILLKAGAVPDSIAVAPGIGGHPGGTAAMGKVVGRDFMTEREDLYVCDGSVLPESPGVPPSLTLMAMSRLFARMLLGQVKPEQRRPVPAREVAAPSPAQTVSAA